MYKVQVWHLFLGLGFVYGLGFGVVLRVQDFVAFSGEIVVLFFSRRFYFAACHCLPSVPLFERASELPCTWLVSAIKRLSGLALGPNRAKHLVGL